MSKFLFVAILFLCTSYIIPQSNITADTTLAASFSMKAGRYFNSGKFDSSIAAYQSASEIYLSYKLWENYIDCQNGIGRNFINLGKYDTSLTILSHAMSTWSKNLGEKKRIVTNTLTIIGNAYNGKGEYDKALEHFLKALALRKELFGEKHPDIAASYNNIGNAYWYKSEHDKALEYFLKALALRKGLFGEKHLDVAASYNNIGVVYNDKGEYDKSLEYYMKALSLRIELLGEKHPDIAGLYNNLGAEYNDKGDYNKALSYFMKALTLRKELHGEKHPFVATAYNNIGVTYRSKGEYDKSLEYYMKALSLRIELLGEKHPDIAGSYNNIGVAYEYKGEYEKALEYKFKALTLRKELLGEKHSDVAASYNNIGITYRSQGAYDKALEYLTKALALSKELFGEKHLYVANSYENIGNTYEDKGEYKKALEYKFKALTLRKELLGEKHPVIISSYNNIGSAYNESCEYDKALEFLMKALSLGKELLSEKDPGVTVSCNNIGTIYEDKGEHDKALHYYQKGLIANITNLADTNIYREINLTNYFSAEDLFISLDKKAKVLYKKGIKNVNNSEAKLKDLLASYSNYKLCENLIYRERRIRTSKTDKMAWGEKASATYEGAISVCLKLADYTKDVKYNQQALFFSESNKAGTLLEAIAGHEGMQFAGIPDSLLQYEHSLKIDINFYEKKIAEVQDSVTDVDYRNRLFNLNRQYEELIASFEKNYPEYYNLKYAASNPSLEEIQKKLDEKTAIRSYFVGDSTIFIFTLTKGKLAINSVPKIKRLDDTVKYFRTCLTLKNNTVEKGYALTAKLLYKQLFPDDIISDKSIENLIIIPDGGISTIPFEALLTKEYKGKTDNYAKYPYLLKRFNISYAYSVNLFYRGLQEEEKTQPRAMQDWLAVAPVFTNEDNSGITLETKQLAQNFAMLNEITGAENRPLIITKDNLISPLPGTESEVRSIWKEYDLNNLKGKVVLHGQANESFIKSGALKDYKILHFATHGFMNSEKPELSGILLAQDTTGGQDGILYSGEIYNLQLNTSLVVLSACETGLGKQKKGEGLIGISRAFLYSGAKNLIASLWQVNDNSTSELMADFYKILLKTGQQKIFSKSLWKAKLKMIHEGKYAHPFYWSPFILIGN